MSRVVSRPSCFFFYSFSSYVFVVAFAISLLFAPSAYADPHAVFYTDRAQEQLFYNTLAALNQADFVEPVTGEFSRDSLGQAGQSTLPSPLPGQTQAQLPFTKEENPTLNATRTLLPGVVTRNITLEGNDLWTAYLFQQFALETDVRRSLSKLSRIICTDALGQTGCNNQPGPSQNQSTAFPTDIKAYVKQELNSFISNLLSGTKTEKDFQDKLTNTTGITPVSLGGKDGPSQQGPPEEPVVPENLKTPRSYSSDIGALHENTKNKPEALNIVNQTTASIIASQYNTGLDPNIFSKFSISDKGDITFPDDASFDDHLDIIKGVTSLLPASIEIAERGREQGAAFKQYREQTPALAKYTLTKEKSGGVKATITHPSTGIEAQINAGAQQLANQTINQNISGIQETTKPGTKPILPTNFGEVAGITTINTPTSSEQPGKVAGVIDFAAQIALLYNDYYNKEQPNLNAPTTGSIPYFEEKGPAELLEALGGTNPNPNPETEKCGFCIALDKIIKSGGVTGTINEVYTDMYCFFFPRTEACEARKT